MLTKYQLLPFIKIMHKKLILFQLIFVFVRKRKSVIVVHGVKHFIPTRG